MTGILKALIARLHQGHRTLDFPSVQPTLPDRFRGRPLFDATQCPESCRACVEACPTNAIQLHPLEASGASLRVDLGRCLFCTDCQESCPEGAVAYSKDFRLATSRREDLVVGAEALKLAKSLDSKMRKLFGRSLKLRQVSAGGCNACEADVNVLNTVVFDLGRFGVQFVASPRHADGLLITGPVSQNMKLALQKTYDAVPSPKIVIAVGACAISGGPFVGHSEVLGGASELLPVDLHVPGCPPHPITILDGILRLLGRIEEKQRR